MKFRILTAVVVAVSVIATMFIASPVDAAEPQVAMNLAEDVHGPPIAPPSTSLSNLSVEYILRTANELVYNYFSPMATGDACQPTAIGAATVTVSDQCLVNRIVRARARLNPDCIVGPIPAGNVYRPRQCNGRGRGAEAIAHARAVRHLNGLVGHIGAGVSQRVQWEVMMPTGKLADIVIQESAANSDVSVYELKTNSNLGDFENVKRQVEGYVTGLEAMPNPYRVVTGNLLSIYLDEFSIELGRCKSDPSVSVVEDYVVAPHPADPRVIVATLVGQTSCPDDDDDDDGDDTFETVEEYEFEEEPEPDWPDIRFVPEKSDDDEDEHNRCRAIYCITEDGIDIPVNSDAYTEEGIRALEEFLEEVAEGWDSAVGNDATVTVGLITIAVVAAVVIGAILFPAAIPAIMAAIAGEAGAASVGLVAGLGLAAAGLLAAVVWGDPHLVTFDGRSYDLQSDGEFDLAISEQLGLHIQARYDNPGTSFSTTAALAARVNGHVVEIDTSRPRGEVMVDGFTVNMEPGQMIDLGFGAAVFAMPNSNGTGTTEQIVVWPGNGIRPVLRVRGRNNMQLLMPKDSSSDLVGLLGNINGDYEDDLRLRDGSLLQDLSPRGIHEEYADSWRITDETSLFTYGPGESTATYTDMSMPANVVTIHDFPIEDQQIAEEFCVDEGIEAGPALDGCIFDVLVSADETFAAAAGAIPIEGVGLMDAGVGDDHTLTADFEGSDTPSNLKGRQLSTISPLGTVSGLYTDGASYRGSVSKLPTYDARSVDLSVIAVGGPLGSGETMTVTVNGADPIVFDETSTPTDSGVLDGGLDYATYGVQVSDQSPATRLEIEVESTGLTAIANEGFAVDNVNIQLDVPDPDVFDVVLNPSVILSPGGPGQGAGSLETQAATDRYRFTVSADDQTTGVDVQQCPSTYYLAWKIVDTNGASMKSGGCSDGQVSLPAGDYELVVSAASGRTGNYQLELMAVPSPDTFDVILDPSIVISNGTPGSGAGSIETVFSTDRYQFTTPEGMHDIGVDVQQCPSTYYLAWKIVDAAGSAVKSGSCSDGQVSLPAGDYELVVSAASGRTGNYQLELMAVPSPDTFDVILDPSIVISNGTPGSGAGSIETVFSTDRYQFTVPTGGDNIGVDVQQCPSTYYLAWKIVDTNGASMKSGGCSDGQVSLPAGDYELVVSAASGRTGNYQLELMAVPSPDTFDVILDPSIVISNGTPGSGAGSIETVFSTDRYQFTTPEGMHDIGVDVQQCPSTYYLAWKIVDAAGSAVKSGSCSDGQVSLPAGDYELVVSAASGRTGNYQLELMAVPSPDTFDVILDPSIVISNGTTRIRRWFYRNSILHRPLPIHGPNRR